MQAARLATWPAVSLLRHLTGGGETEQPVRPRPSASPPVRPRRPVDWNAEPTPPSPPPRAPEPPPEPEPVVEEVVEAILEEEHVSEEPELVAESADPGATESPGPELTVEEPWPGYRRMKAAEVIAALPDLSREELAVAELFESTSRKRRTVLEAMERQLKVSSPPRS
jgi:hypothetical protein